MADKISLEIVTPERRVLAIEVDEVVIPSHSGSMGVLPGHAPLLAVLDVGEMSYRIGNDRKYLSVSGGFAEVLRRSVSVLAPQSELAEEIDVDRAELARSKAEKSLDDAKLDEQVFDHAKIRLRKAVTRIQVHGRLQG